MKSSSVGGMFSLLFLTAAASLPAELPGPESARPWLNLDAPKSAVRTEKRIVAKGLDPLSMTTGDFDADGIPDLVCGYSGDDGGALVVFRGNIRAIYPSAEKDALGRPAAPHTEAFLGASPPFEIPDAPDFLVSGDFDADGRRDLVLGRRRAGRIWLIRGDGSGGFRPAESRTLPGRLTVLAAADIDLPDGLPELIVGLDGDRGKRGLLLVESLCGAWPAVPEFIPSAEVVTDIATGHIDRRPGVDLLAAAGDEVLLISGRRAGRGDGNARTIRRIAFPASRVAVVNLIPSEDYRPELALLSGDGILRILSDEGRLLDQRRVGDAAAPNALAPGRLSSLAGSDLVLATTEGIDLLIPSAVPKELPVPVHTAFKPWMVRIHPDPQIRAVVLMRLNEDALSDIVYLEAGDPTPKVIIDRSTNSWVVNSTLADADGDFYDGVCDTGNSTDGFTGLCTLRAALVSSYYTPGSDLITFDLGPGTPHAPGSGPTLSEPLTILGDTGGADRVHAGDPSLQPLLDLEGKASTVRNLVFSGAHLDFSADGSIIEGCLIGLDVDGETQVDASRCIITHDCLFGGSLPCARNVVAPAGNYGLSIAGSESIVRGNYFGTEIGGAHRRVLYRAVSIYSDNAQQGVTIGGTGPWDANVISGAQTDGVHAEGDISDIVIQGNRIGTSADGTESIPNDRYGIFLATDAALIGGTEPGAGNIVSGNGDSGIYLDDFPTDITVQGNVIGTGPDGEGALGNTGDGILVSNTATRVVIGGEEEGAANIIANNGGAGIRATNNNIMASENSIHSNGALGIDIGTSGPSTNDQGDLDGVPNYPVFTDDSRAERGTMTFTGIMQGHVDSSYRLEFFSSSACDPSGHGEGAEYLGTIDVDVGSVSDVSFSFSTSKPAAVVTATARNAATGATSEFSSCEIPALNLLPGPVNGALQPVPAPATGVVVMHLALQAWETADVVVDSALFHSSGQGDEAADITAVRLFLDTDGDGVVGGSDPQIGGPRVFSVDDGTVLFSSLGQTIPAGQRAYWILTYDLSAAACPCEDYRPSLDAFGLQLSSGGGPARAGGRLDGRFLEVAPGSLTISGGDHQAALLSGGLPDALAVSVGGQAYQCDALRFEVLDTPVGASGQHFSNGRTVVTVPFDSGGTASTSLTLGNVKGDYTVSYALEIPSGISCDVPRTVAPDPPFTATAVGLALSDSLAAFRPAETTARTFIDDIQAGDTFTARLDPEGTSLQLTEVVFSLGAVQHTDTTAPFEGSFDMAALNSPEDTLHVSATVGSGASSQQISIETPVLSIDFPSWFSIVEAISTGFSKSFEAGARQYSIGYTYPNDFTWNALVDDAVAFLGGEESDMGSGVAFNVGAIYDLDSNSILEGNAGWNGEIFGANVGFSGWLRAYFDRDFEFRPNGRPSGGVRARVGVDLPEKSFSRTFMVWAVPVTVALDLGGEIQVVCTGTAWFDDEMRFKKLLVSPEPSLTLEITASVSAAFGMARVAATAAPTVAARIHLPYTSLAGLQDPTFGGQLLVELELNGSVFWGTASATLGSATLGPYTWGDWDGTKPDPEARALDAPRFLPTASLAADDAGRVIAVFTRDTGTSSPDPEIGARVRSGGTWTTTLSVTSGNSRWELDPAVTFLSGGDALALWTSNRGAKSLDNLREIFNWQELAYSVFHDGSWSAEADLTGDLEADGSADLAYDPTLGKAVAVWVHDDDNSNAPDIRTDWEIHAALFDPATATWTAATALTADAAADFAPAVAASAGTAMAVWCEDGDGEFFIDPALPPGEDGTISGGSNVDMSNSDARVVFSLFDGSAWSAKSEIEAGGGPSVRIPEADVAGLSGSRFAAVWIRHEGTADRLLCALYDGGWSAPFEVASSQQFIESPSVAATGANTVALTYRAHDPDAPPGHRYAGNLFEVTVDFSRNGGARAEVGKPKALTSGTTAEIFPEAIADADGDLVVSWTGFDPDSSGDGLADGLNIGQENGDAPTISTSCSESTPDLDGDGLADRLDLCLSVDLATAGDYLLAGDLYDGEGEFIRRAEAVETGMSAGSGTICLAFDGRGLGGGAYRLRNLRLSRVGISPLVAASLMLGCTTPAYPAGFFEPAPLRFDAAEYLPGSTATLSLEDDALDLDPQAPDTAAVRLWSSEDTDGISVEVMETGNSTGSFEGPVVLGEGASDDAADVIHISSESVVWARRRSSAGDILLAEARIVALHITDGDDDGVPDGSDNCPGMSNSGQLDGDGDGFGDDCDPYPAAIRGDVNCDGGIDLLDASDLLRHLSDTRTVCGGADVDHDSDIDARDLDALLEILFDVN